MKPIVHSIAEPLHPAAPQLQETHPAAPDLAPPITDASAWMAWAVESYEAQLVQYTARLLAGDIDRARDVVQDAFLKLWTADRQSIAGHLGQWLYRVCRNRALDVRRKEHRMTVVHDEQLDRITGSPNAGGDEASLTTHAGRGDSTPHSPAVVAMLDSLNETQAEALRLKFQGGLSYKEIAAVMDITSNHVGVIIHNAIKALREHAAAAAAMPKSIRGEV